MSAKENAGNSDDGAVSGGKVWNPQKMGFQGLSNILIPALFFLAMTPLYLSPNPFGKDNVDEWLSMTEAIWTEGEQSFTLFYVCGGTILLTNIVAARLARRTKKFWMMFFGIVGPIAIVSIALTIVNPFVPETSLAEEWAKKHYGYTLLEEPVKNKEVINVRTSDGVEKKVNVIELNDHIYLADDDTTSGEFFVKLYDAKESNE